MKRLSYNTCRKSIEKFIRKEYDMTILDKIDEIVELITENINCKCEIIIDTENNTIEIEVIINKDNKSFSRIVPINVLYNDSTFDFVITIARAIKEYYLDGIFI